MVATTTQDLFEFDSIESAVASFATGQFVVVVDNEDRENEGDLIIAAQHVTADKMAFLIRHSSGLVCIPMPGDRLDALNLPLMVPENTDTYKTAFTVSVDYNKGTTTGISAHDRALTARQLANPTSTPNEFNRPGHLFPLRYTEGGVLVRPGHTEAAIDLCRLANQQLAGIICELVNEDGSMSRRDDLKVFATKHGFKMISIADLQSYIKARLASSSE
jgi:3,4-dihydroxy-2-butanone 4-phosphate synthase